MAEYHVVEEYKLGNTRIKIADDYCRVKTKEQLDKLLREIADTALRNINSAFVVNKIDKTEKSKRNAMKVNEFNKTGGK